jgi:hypothetical protein
MSEEPERRGTVKTSTILIADSRRTAVYRTVDEVPADLRAKLTESTTGENAGAVLIADRRGAQELVRANVRAILEQRIESPGLRALVAEDLRQLTKILRVCWRPATALALAALLLWLALR